ARVDDAALEEPLRARARDELHDHVVELFLRVDVEDGDDVFVANLRGGARLAEEALDERVLLLLGRGRERDHLDGDVDLERAVPAAVNGAHAAAADALDDLALADDGARLEGAGPAG